MLILDKFGGELSRSGSIPKQVAEYLKSDDFIKRGLPGTQTQLHIWRLSSGVQPEREEFQHRCQGGAPVQQADAADGYRLYADYPDDRSFAGAPSLLLIISIS